MTLIAVSIAVHRPDDVSTALARAKAAVKFGAALVEWRVDELANESGVLLAAARLVRDSPAPCILTCRPHWEGGDYEGDEPTRIELMVQLMRTDHPPRYIDIELRAFERDPAVRRKLRDELSIQAARGRAPGLIVSSHDFQGRPADLLQRVERMTHDPMCAVIKVAWHARSLRDNFEAFELLATRRKPMIALCMGQFGLMSRVLAGKFGALVTFASDAVTEVTAPGQPTIDELIKLYRFGRVVPSTKVYGVIGWPVEHSLSPAVHNAGFEAVGHDGVYLPMPIPGGTSEYEHFKATVGSLVDATGLDFRGASVTIPHKENLLRFVRERGGRSDELTEQIGAANALVVGSAGGLECLNTDCPAAIQALCEGMRISEKQLAGKQVLVFGAGGAARAVVVGLLRARAHPVVFNRNEDRARALADELNGSIKVVDARTLSGTKFDIIINCTPVGMAGTPHENESPLPPDVQLDEHVTVMDTVYAPAQTRLIQDAAIRGARVIPGTEMFIRQAAMQFERWTGKPAPIDAFERELGRPTVQTGADPRLS
jgi:3-dehydroquinate dehydratase/shikimate dehydrogenase